MRKGMVDLGGVKMVLIFQRIKTGDLTVSYNEVLDKTCLIGRISIRKTSLTKYFGEIPERMYLEVQLEDRKNIAKTCKDSKRKKADKKADSRKGKSKTKKARA